MCIFFIIPKIFLSYNRFFNQNLTVDEIFCRRSSTPSASPQTNNNGARPRTKRPNLNQEQGNGNRRTPACLNLLDVGETSRQNSRSSLNSHPDHSHATNLSSVMPETLITSKPL